MTLVSLTAKTATTTTTTTTFKARQIVPYIIYDGANTELSQYLKSLSYTDNASGAIDDLSITLLDKNGNWNDWTPEKETDIEAEFELTGYTTDGLTYGYHCGNFAIDDISYGGWPLEITVGAISEPAGTGFKATSVTKTWEQILLKNIVLEIMDKHDIEKLYYYADDILIEKLEQDNKSDSEFLSELCSTYSLELKIYKKAIVIFSKDVYEDRGTSLTITPEKVQSGWSWNSTLQGTYTGGTLSYTDASKGIDISVTVGTSERLLILNEQVGSYAEADTKIRNAVNEANRSAVEFSFTLKDPDPDMVASCNIAVSGFGDRIDGKYYVKQVNVSWDANSGLSMSVQCHKIFARL